MASAEPFGAPGDRADVVVEREGSRDDGSRAEPVVVTVGLGIVNEVYWPTTGEPQMRDERTLAQ